MPAIKPNEKTEELKERPLDLSYRSREYPIAISIPDRPYAGYDPSLYMNPYYGYCSYPVPQLSREILERLSPNHAHLPPVLYMHHPDDPHRSYTPTSCYQTTSYQQTYSSASRTSSNSSAQISPLHDPHYHNTSSPSSSTSRSRNDSVPSNASSHEDVHGTDKHYPNNNTKVKKSKSLRPFKAYDHSKSDYAKLRKSLDAMLNIDSEERFLEFKKKREEAHDMKPISNPNMRRVMKREDGKSISDTYAEKRQKNNMAAKKSRDNRKKKEDAMAVRIEFLEQENSIQKQAIILMRDLLPTEQKSRFSNENLYPDN